MSSPDVGADAPKEEPMTLKDFLESVPPGLAKLVDPAYKLDVTCRLLTPAIQLHCPSESCKGIRYFRWDDQDSRQLFGDTNDLYVTYRCGNCKEATKLFALGVRPGGRQETWAVCYKYGEMPTFGPPTSRRLLRLLEPDQSLFLKGRQCENQGLGVGAFSYYRQVVDQQTGRIFERIIEVAEKTQVGEGQVATLKKAREAQRFSEALDLAKDALPPTLLIDGQHNPMKALYSALSKGLHTGVDDECLAMASRVRLVLADLAERMATVLHDKAELLSAFNDLSNMQVENEEG